MKSLVNLEKKLFNPLYEMYSFETLKKQCNEVIEFALGDEKRNNEQ